MLVQEREVESFGDLPAPATTAHSVLLAAQKPFYQVGLMAEAVIPGLGTHESRRNMAEKIETIDSVLNDPRLGRTQRAFDWVSEIAAPIIPTLPLSVVGGVAARGVAVGIGAGIRGIAPDALLAFSKRPLTELAGSTLGKYLPQELNAAEAATSLADQYGFYKGFVIPEHVVENYHKENDVLDYRGAIQDWSGDNYGFLLGALPFVAGYIGYKGIGNVIKKRKTIRENEAVTHELSRLLKEHEVIRNEHEENATFKKDYIAKTSELQSHLHQAVEEGHLSAKEHDWYLDYLFNPDDHENLSKSAMKIMQQAGIPYDRVTGQIWFPLVEKSDLKNLKSAIQDEVTTAFSDEERRALSAYVVHNRMDSLRTMLADNPNMLHGIRGYSHFIDAKLGSKEKAFQNLDHILTHHLPKGLGKKELFSQNNIYKHLKKNGMHDISRIPYTVPEGVAHKLKLSKKIDAILSRKGARYEQWYKEGLHHRLKEELKAVKLLTPAEELEHLKNTLVAKGKLIDNFKNHKAYHRLEELSQLWSNAKHLLDRIHMESEYQKQAAFNEVLKNFVNIVDSNASRFADPSRVTRYLKKRVETAVPFARQFQPLEVSFEREAIEKVDQSVVLENTRIVEESGFSGLKEIIQEQTAKMAQLEEHSEALTELINCALGE